MASRADRRSVLTGLGALGLAACGRAPAGPDGALDLSALEARHGGRLGLLASGAAGAFAYWREEERFVYCSTFKLFLAAATLRRVVDNQESLSRAIPITRADMLEHAPVTGPAVGGTLTIEALCQAAVEQSDNPAANILIREMGGLGAFTAWYRSIGDSVTNVSRLEPELNRPNLDMDTTTPRQAVNDMVAIFGTHVLPPAYNSQFVRWLIASPTGPGRIKAGVPAGWRVAHKTGTGAAGQTNDIGMLFSPSGAPVIIAVYFDAPSSTTQDQRDAVIADATRIALKALGHD